MTSKEDIKREFDEFAQKVGQLEAFRQELDSLDTRGFETEVKLIRAKLKNINAISEIRKELDDLHHKIAKKSGVSVEKRVINNKLLRDSKELKEETQELKNKIEKLEDEIEEKKKLSAKAGISSKQAGYLKEIPKLEEELRNLRKKFDEHTKHSNVKIDSGVGVIVDTKFDDFVNELKGEITERIQQKELSVDAELKADLQQREKVFAEHYRNLVREFQNRYKQRVEGELKKEVSQKFQEEVQRALNAEKKAIVEALVKEHALRIQADKRRMVTELEAKYGEKEKRFQKGLEESMKKERENLSKKRSLIEKKIEKIRTESERAEKEHADAERILREYEEKRKESRAEGEKLNALLLKQKSEVERLARLKNKIAQSMKNLDRKKRADKDYTENLRREKERVRIEEEKARKEHIEAKKILNEHLKKEKEFENKNKKDVTKRKSEMQKLARLKNKIAESMRLLQNEQKRHIDFENKVRAKAELEARKKMAAYTESNNRDFLKRIQNMKNQFNKELSESVRKQREKDRSEFVNALTRKELELKSKFEKDCEIRVKQEVARKEREMEAKKKEFESHIMEQAKKLFH